MYIFLPFLLTLIVGAQRFADFKLEMQDKVKWVAGNMSKAFGDRCLKKITDCEEKSYNMCEGTGGRICLEDFPTPDVCSSSGSFFSDESGVRVPNNVDLSNLSIRQRQFICTSTQIYSTFQTISSQNENRHSYAYFGSSTGAFRVMPSFMQIQENEECKDYDPRIRPWYSSGVSGGKNIIIIMDISRSMGGGRLENSIDAVVTVLQTLSVHDFIGIVVFSTDARILGGYDRIQRAQQDVVNKLKNEVQSLQVQDSTNYEKGISKGMELLVKSVNDQYGQCPENILMFMTDGRPSEGKDTSDQLIEMIEQKVNEIKTGQKKIRFMSYAFGNEFSLDMDLLNEISCHFDGILSHIEQFSQLKSQLQNYYLYLAEGVNRTQPIWSEPYEDAFGLGKIVTVSMPVYYIDSNNLTTILGVAGIDVLMQQMTAYELSQEDVLRTIFTEPQCFNTQLTECKLQLMRNQQWRCNKNCALDNTELEQCTNPITKNVWKDPVNSEIDEDKCCGPTHEELKVIIGLSVGLGALVIIAVILVVVYKYKKKSTKYEDSPKKTDSTPKQMKNDSQDFLEEIQDQNSLYKKAEQAGIKIYRQPFQ